MARRPRTIARRSATELVRIIGRAQTDMGFRSLLRMELTEVLNGLDKKLERWEKRNLYPKADREALFYTIQMAQKFHDTLR